VVAAGVAGEAADPSVFAAPAVLSALACFPAVMGCGVAVVGGLAWVEASEPSDVLLSVCAAVLATGAFVAGVVLATCAATVALAVAAMPVWVAGRFAGVLVAVLLVVYPASVGAWGVGGVVPAVVSAAIVGCACGAAADGATAGAVVD